MLVDSFSFLVFDAFSPSVYTAAERRLMLKLFHFI